MDTKSGNATIHRRRLAGRDERGKVLQSSGINDGRVIGKWKTIKSTNVAARMEREEELRKKQKKKERCWLGGVGDRWKEVVAMCIGALLGIWLHV